MPCGREDITVRAGPLRIALMWAIRACQRRKSVASCLRRRRRQRTAPWQAPAHASRAAVSTPTAARHAARGAARLAIPTPVSSSSMRRRSRRRIQISTRDAAKSIAATRAACQRTSGTARGRPPGINFYCIYAVAAFVTLRTFTRSRIGRHHCGPGPDRLHVHVLGRARRARRARRRARRRRRRRPTACPVGQ